jgi:uncharacterized protein
MTMRPSLAERLRAVVGGSSAVPRVDVDAGVLSPTPGGAPQALFSHAPGPDRGARARQAAHTLGGVVVERPEGLCIVVDRHYPAGARHGRHRVGDVVGALRQSVDGLSMLRRAWPAARAGEGVSLPLLGPAEIDGLCVIDLETTGLAGGAGTQAFLVGCARIDGDGVFVRQFLSPGFEHERAQLATLAEWMQDRSHLITFNGRTFDLPLLEMRFSFNRVAWPWAHLPHLDALHPARRFWRDRAEVLGPDPDESSCSLGVLEKRLSGVHRVGDVPGFEIPARFFQFARDGRAEPLEAVLEHNRLDLLSTLQVCARAATFVVRGPAATDSGYECLGLGRLYERLASQSEAEACYERAAAHGARMSDARLRAESLRRLAVCLRRAGRLDAAADAWRGVLATRGVSAMVRREAREALAIFQEHRARDFGAARRLVIDALAEPLADRHRENAQRRLARLDRKLSRAIPGQLIKQLDDEALD